ncbi:class I SAM-dependent methyltransferase [bacterium]|nr:class I SAM-dependent methyltransferase [bacterium]
MAKKLPHPTLAWFLKKWRISFNRAPRPIRKFLEAVGLDRLSSTLLTKEAAELAFQRDWAREFKGNEDQVKAYWESYRHWGILEGLLGLGNDATILDVGCGISTVLHFLPGERHGVDPLGKRYKELYDYPEGIEIHGAPGEKIPFGNGRFSVVFCSNALDHCTDPAKVVSEIHRVLGEGGHFVLTVERFEVAKERDAAHPHSLTREALMNLLGDRFEVLLERESPWIGIKKFLRGERASSHLEATLLLRRT